MNRAFRHVATHPATRLSVRCGAGHWGSVWSAGGIARPPGVRTKTAKPYGIQAVPGLASGVGLRGPTASVCPPAPADGDPRAAELGDEEDPLRRRRRLEAVLLMTKSPLSTRKLAQLARLADGTEARTLVRELNRLYDSLGRALRVEQVAGGYRIMTRPALAPWLVRLGHLPPAVRLSSPMMETLTVVAYRQPVSRADVEAIRGVNCGELLRQLLERDLIRIAGRGEELGRPYLYGTTKRFLQLFGLSGTEALPVIDWLAMQEETARESSTLPKEAVVITAVAPVGPETETDNLVPFAAVLPVAPLQAGTPSAVIEDEEDEIYEGGGDDDDDLIDEWEVEGEDVVVDDADDADDVDELDEEEEVADEQDVDAVDDDSDDDEEEEEVADDWVEVDDSDDDEDWDDDDDEWDDDEDDDEDWD